MNRHVVAYDGLRGVAILLVFIHHFGLFHRSAVGPEIFFVLSGYLITRNLQARQHLPVGTILTEFYKRRLYRLGPPLAWLLAAAVAIMLFLPHLDREIGQGILAAVTYSTNWQHAYTEWKCRSLGHLWSLAAEQQFYLIWPPIFLVTPRHFRKPLLLALLVGVVLWRFWLHSRGASFERLYFGLDTHADGLIVGCLLAMVSLPERIQGLLRGGGCLALVGAVGAALLLPVHSPLSLAISTLFVTLVSAILVVATPLDGPLQRLLSCPPLRALGMVSYSLYLWHFPVSTIFWPDWSHGRALARVTAAVALGVVNYLLIERPIVARLQQGRRTPSRPELNDSGHHAGLDEILSQPPALAVAR